MENQLASPLLNWIPYKLIENEDVLFFEWLYLGETKYQESFFDETILKCKGHAFHSKGYKVVSGVDTLIEWASQMEAIPLTGLIFHVSRCGSTLMSQALAIPSCNIVVPEAAIIDQIIRSEKIDEVRRQRVLNAVLKFLGQKRSKEQTHFMIKLDSWHLMRIQMLRSYFPEIPFLILTRNPIEVLKSHARERGMQMVPLLLPAKMFGLCESDVQKMTFDEYGAKVLEVYLQAIIDFAKLDANTWVYDYKIGAANLLEAFIAKLGIRFSEIDLENMRNRLKTHSKDKERVFVADEDSGFHVELTAVNAMYEKMLLYAV